MKSFDLVKFAEHSQKVPSSFLSYETKGKSRPGLFKILCAHAIDFYLALSATILIGLVFHESLRLLMITKGLRTAFSMHQSLELFPLLFPIIIMSYFFTSYYMNNGQTYGMHLTKTRIHLSDFSIQSSLRWTFFSLSLFLTMGLRTHKKHEWFQKSGWGMITTHDHLYHELLEHRLDMRFNLVEECEKMPEEENYLRAA